MKYPNFRLVFDRKNTSSAAKTAPVYVEITLSSRKKYISTGIRIYPSEWNKQSQMIKGRHDAIILNQRLQKTLFDYQSYILTLQNDDIPFSFASFDVWYKSKNIANTKDFLGWLKSEIENRDIEESTRTQHLVAYRKLEAYGKIKKFTDVNDIAFKDFHKWLKTKDMKGRSLESIFGVHKRIKPYIKIAKQEKLIRENPYDYIKLEREKNTAVRYLNEDELNRITTCQIESKSVSRVRDLFVFACCTGLAYSDLQQFDKRKIQTVGQYQVYSSLRQKTRNEFTFVLIPLAISILEKYNYKLPQLTNQKYNQYLKLVAHYAGIDKQLTTHMARHTFATTVMLAKSISLHVVQKALGHSKIATTEKYAKVLNSSVISEMSRLV